MKVLIVLPAYNEAKIIRENTEKLLDFVQKNLLDDQIQIVIADNNSKDQTSEIGKELAAKYDQIAYEFVAEQGKGYAVLSPWLKMEEFFDIFIFMDADLATDLQDLPYLIFGIKQGFDLVIGSRRLSESRVNKSLSRHIFSSCYHWVLKVLLGTKINDLPCGFKSINRRALKDLVPLIKDRSWFFDSELVYLGEKKGFKIKEIPVKWQEPRVGDDKSRVNLWKVSWLYLKRASQLKFRKIS